MDTGEKMSKKKSSRYKQTRYQNVKKGGSPAVKNIADGQEQGRQEYRQRPTKQVRATQYTGRRVSNLTIILSVAVVALMAMVVILVVSSGGSPDANGNGGTTIPGANNGDGTLLVSSGTVPKQGNPGGTWTPVEMQGDAVKIPKSYVSEAATWYAADVDGVWVKFFILKSSDGTVRAAFDACDVCYSNLKGYHQEGDMSVCNNCGLNFPSAAINVDVRGCNPIYLPFTDDGSSYVITKSDLTVERSKFT
jgi:hypothetical protein